jgi:hypothetical protein
MDAVLLATWAAVGVVVLLYILFIVWRVRVDRRKKAKPQDAAAATDEARLARALDAAARLASQEGGAAPTAPTTTAPAAAPAPTISAPPISAPPSAPPVLAPTRQPDTVAQLLAGIRLPRDLAPLTTMANRPGAGDRVAFWTDRAGAEVVGPEFVDELERIGCEVTQLDVSLFAINRDGGRANAMLYADGHNATIDGARAYPSVPANAFVVEIWLAS